MERLLFNLDTAVRKCVFGPIVNIWLVANDARPGMLFAHYDLIRGMKDKQVEVILEFAQSLNLPWRKLSDYKYLISNSNTMAEFVNTDLGIGKALGFQCYNHEFYHDHKRDRFVKYIYIEYGNAKTEIVEVADAKLITEQELTEHMNKKIEDFRKVLPSNFVVSGHIEFIPSARVRQANLRNIEYVRANIEKYMIDVYNLCEIIDRNRFERIVTDTDEYNKYLPLLEFVYATYICA